MKRKLLQNIHQRETLSDSEIAGLPQEQEKRSLMSIFKKTLLVRKQIKTAEFHLSEKNFQEAILFFDQALAINKNSRQALSGKKRVIFLLIEEGIGHLCDNKFDEAIMSFNEVLKIDSEYPDAYEGLCTSIRAKFSQIII